MKKTTLFFIVPLLLSCVPKKAAPTVLRGTAFGTTYTVQYFSETGFNAKKGIDSVVQAVNSSVSTYLPNSAISKINRGDPTVVVDA
ncbi:MAG: FAD:protein FMN transferase, partial [Marinirhabdus sp.]